MQKIERLNWDSSFFGYEVGKVELKNSSFFDLVDFKQKTKDYELIYVFSNQVLFSIKQFEVDVKVQFFQLCSEINYECNEKLQSFNPKYHNFDELKKLALESGIFSRFNIDTNFRNQEYEKLYIRWIENAVNEDFTFDIIIALNNDNSIIGFATINKKNNFTAEIGLVAVSKWSRGLGIGKQLIKEAILRSYNAGFSEIQVVTQMNNLAAMNLYQSSNFNIKEITNIYHIWNR